MSKECLLLGSCFEPCNPGIIQVFMKLFLYIFLQIGQDIEVRPGIVSKTSDGKIFCQPIQSRVVSLFAEQNDLQFAVPGGLIGKLL